MFYTEFIDLTGHFFRGNLQVMRKFYLEADRFVKKMKNKIKRRNFFLVVSDHGMKKLTPTSIFGEHSDHAFYSTNLPLNRKVIKITDWYAIIVERLREH